LANDGHGLTNETALTVWWIVTWSYVAIGLSMAVLLLASFIRREPAQDVRSSVAWQTSSVA